MLHAFSYVRKTPNVIPAVRNTFSAAGIRRALRLQDFANEHPHDAAIQAAFLKELGSLNPMSVIRRVESNKFAKNDLVKKEYLKALAKSDRLTPASLASIFQDLYDQPESTSTPTTTTTTPLSAATLQSTTNTNNINTTTSASTTTTATSNFFNTNNSNNSNNFTDFPNTTNNASGILQPSSRINLTSGLSSAHPLKLQMPKPSMWDEVWATVRVLLGTFVVVSGLVFLSDSLQPSNRFGVTDAEYTPVTLPSKSFNDVKGCDEAVEELREVVAYLRDPSVYTRLGGKLPKGLLLTGPPGTGKTLLARAVSGEAGVPFFYASGSEFDEVFVGVGARRMRALFQTAKQHAPCIVFIDEIDAVGGKRNPRDTHSSKMTLNQMLVEMDGFEGSDGVIVIGATNFPDLLDSALTRPGRFDRQLPVQAPDVKGREQILGLYLSNMKTNKPELCEMVNVIARGTPGFTGAELENLVNMASIHATSRNASGVTLQDLEFAREKILMGPERKTYRLTPESRVCTAHHEAGHALVAAMSRDSDPVYKATILPRGRALGMVQQLPEDDQYSMNVANMQARLDIMMAGRVAEEMLLGANDYTSGASSDLEQATSLARAMVSHWGLSSRVGPIYLGEEGMPVSPALQRIVDEEVESLLKSAYERARTMITANRSAHISIANALLERETLTGQEILEVINKASTVSEESSSTTTPSLPATPKHTPAVSTKAPSIARAAS